MSGRLIPSKPRRAAGLPIDDQHCFLTEIEYPTDSPTVLSCIQRENTIQLQNPESWWLLTPLFRAYTLPQWACFHNVKVGLKAEILFVMDNSPKDEIPLWKGGDKEEDSAFPICFSLGESKRVFGFWAHS